MASTHHNPRRISESPEGERSALTRDYDDDAFSSSHESNASVRKPLSSFCTDDEEDLEDGFVKKSAKVRGFWWRLKNTMTVRERRKASLGAEGYKDLNDDVSRLLADVYAAKQTRRTRNWYNYCIFGGISGLSILLVFCIPRAAQFANLTSAFLLVLNLLLGLATLLWTSDLDHVLRNWGRPGTGT